MFTAARPEVKVAECTQALADATLPAAATLLLRLVAIMVLGCTDAPPARDSTELKIR